MAKKALFTVAEDENDGSENFPLIYGVDEHDCLYFAEGLSNLNYEVNFVNWKDFDGKEFSRMFNYNSQKFSNESLNDMNLIFVYKQEGFLSNLHEFENMLNRFESSGAKIVNDPSTIRKNISKDYLFELQEEGFNVIPTYEIGERLLGEIEKGKRFVVKPKIAERGNDQELAISKGQLESYLSLKSDYLAQEFFDSIYKGERSLSFIGKSYSHAVIKYPSGDHRANESLGGYTKVYEPREKEIDFAKNILEYWESKGYPVHYNRIDILDYCGEPYLVEAELLNPSIYANYAGKGKEYGDNLANYLDGLVLKNEGGVRK